MVAAVRTVKRIAAMVAGKYDASFGGEAGSGDPPADKVLELAKANGY